MRAIAVKLAPEKELLPMTAIRSCRTGNFLFVDIMSYAGLGRFDHQIQQIMQDGMMHDLHVAIFLRRHIKINISLARQRVPFLKPDKVTTGHPLRRAISAALRILRDFPELLIAIRISFLWASISMGFSEDMFIPRSLDRHVRKAASLKARSGFSVFQKVRCHNGWKCMRWRRCRQT